MSTLIVPRNYKKNMTDAEYELIKLYSLYYTPLDLAFRLVGLVHLEAGMRVLEPSAGIGSFVQALNVYHPQVNVYCVELMENNCEILRKYNVKKVLQKRFEHIRFPEDRKFDLIIGNPPYPLAVRHVTHGFKFLKQGGYLAFLLRLNLLGSSKRYQFWQDYPPKMVYALTERPSFIGGTDQTEYAFFVFQKGWQGISGLKVISWK